MVPLSSTAHEIDGFVEGSDVDRVHAFTATFVASRHNFFNRRFVFPFTQLKPYDVWARPPHARGGGAPTYPPQPRHGFHALHTPAFLESIGGRL